MGRLDEAYSVQWMKKVGKSFFEFLDNIRMFASKVPYLAFKANFHENVLPLIAINKEFHQIIDIIESLFHQELSRTAFISSLYKIKDKLTYIQENKDLLTEYPDMKQGVLNQIESILSWLEISISKFINMMTLEKYSTEDLHRLLKFIYESTWKLIIIFEEVLAVPCKQCETNGRIVIYKNLFTDNNTNILSIKEESKTLEEDIVAQIKHLE